MEDSGGGGVVEGAEAGGVRPGGHEESGVGGAGFGFEEDVCGLSGGDEKGVGFEWLDVNGVGVDYGESVVGDTEKELIVECSVDKAEKVSFSWLHL